MKIIDRAKLDGKMTLCDLIDYRRDHGFTYEGHRYVPVLKHRCAHQVIDPGTGMILCFNLKSHTFRALARCERVTPIVIEVSTHEGKERVERW